MDGFLPETKNLKKVLTPGPAAGRGKWRLLSSRNNTSPSSGRMLSEGNVFQKEMFFRQSVKTESTRNSG
jgi:hypothetical protein